ncbi:hypothetical protein B0J13DRAFT_140877 [Dactylonectria estremocensis]|uniref:Uncharacterized protein n=1 Tax=Dactylonectria estremocensis TaxID=1079267 RepID=A0A9P9E461_9HYPO|nr:hypothetical protein B0J13DRAFT_140877 [Dactylonectria estremocensis]
MIKSSKCHASFPTVAAMQRTTISTGVPALTSSFSCSSTDLSWSPNSDQNCSPFRSNEDVPLLIAILVVLHLCSCQAFPGPPFLLFTEFARRLYVSGTVGGTARNCPSRPVLSSIFAACTVIDDLQRMLLMSTHGCLPAHISCRSSIQFLHSSRMCRTVCDPRPH